MFLSRLVLNPRSRRAQQESANPYELHRTVMNAFPETLPEDERVLFRLETDRQIGVLTLLVQSQYAPDWGFLDDARAEGYLIRLRDPNPWTKEFDPVIDVNQEYVFRLRANPTVKRNGKRLALVREEDQLGWLQRKAAIGGFDVLSVRIQDQGFVEGKTRRQEALKLIAVQYDGVLKVTDAHALWQSLVNGVGSAKGLGFGLLSLAAVT